MAGEKIICNKSDLVNVADAIRSKLGVTNTYHVSELSDAINSISTGGTPNLQSKSVTYTSNGTATVTPDAGYDGLSSVDVTVNVSGGGSSSEVVTLRIMAGGPPFWSSETKCYATGEEGIFEITDYGTYNVLKNSMVFLTGSIVGRTNITEIYSNPPTHILQVTGNGSISIG